MRKKKGGIAEDELLELPADGRFAPADHTGIVRGRFREPIHEDDAVSAQIAGQDYQVLDIGSHGLGILVHTVEAFLKGESCSITLRIDTRTLALTGRVSHVSPTEYPDAWLCGIELTEMTTNSEQLLQRFLHAHHAMLFGKES